jgi:hypothetical protein
MAITASVSMNPTTITVGTPCTMTVNVANSGGANVTVLNIIPYATFTGGTNQQTTAINFGSAPVGTGLAVTVTAGGNTNFPIGVSPLAGSTGPTGALAGTFTFGALVTTSDGSNVTASTATLTVNALQTTYIAAQQTGINPLSYV